MAQVKVVHDPDNQTIMIFFADPGGDVHSEPFDDKTDLLRNGEGEVIGIMRSEYESDDTVVDVSVETHRSTQLPDE